MTRDDVREEAGRRAAGRRAELERWSRRELAVSVSRLVVAVSGVVVLWVAVQSGVWSAWWTLLPVAGFLGLMSAHERLLRRVERGRRAVAFWEAAVARVEERWRGAGVGGSEHEPEGHLYAGDLDLFGEASLFELLCRARTRAGEETLAAWLLEPAAPGEIAARQEAVRELAGRLELREDLASLGAEVRADVDPESLERWALAEADGGGQAPSLPVQPPRSVENAEASKAPAPPQALPTGLWFPATLVLLGVGNVATLFGWLVLGWGSSAFLGFALAGAALFAWIRHRVLGTVEGVEKASRDLRVMAELLDRIAGAGADEIAAPWLQERQAALRAGGGRSAGDQIRRLSRLVELLESRRNAFFAPLGALVFWTTHCALRIAAWRRRNGREVAGWLRVLGEVEALASLAGHAWEWPDDVFPEVVSPEGAASSFEADGIGHPLLPFDDCVRNDVAIAPPLRGLVVSGSNMSGKSTFLRACGTNAVLAQAGGTVRAARLRMTPLRVGASIQIVDSLQQGASKFYAEIQRLRSILDLTDGEIPVLFLLDEILHGTNSHDRRIGAAAVIRGLLDRGAIGLVTTHDLALARIGDEDERLENVHFVDHVEEGRIRFDYRLREGVVQRSNALALMREVGLDV